MASRHITRGGSHEVQTRWTAGQQEQEGGAPPRTGQGSWHPHVQALAPGAVPVQPDRGEDELPRPICQHAPACHPGSSCTATATQAGRAAQG